MSQLGRRQFMKLAGAATGAWTARGLLGCDDGRALESGSEVLSRGPRNRRGAGSALADTGPMLEARTPASLMMGSDAELDIELGVVSGRLPTDMSGHVFMMAAVPFGDGSMVVNGNGMVHRVDFGESRVAMRSRIVKTACYYVDQATRGTMRQFRNQGPARLSLSLGVRNEANTAVVPMGDRLLVTFDAGRPHEIDPVTLEVVTPVGALSEWRRAMPAVLLNGPLPLDMASAHPYFDEHTGEMFMPNFSMMTMPGTPMWVDLLRWTGDGALERWSVVLENGHHAAVHGSMHQVGVTQDYVILMDCAFSTVGSMLPILPSRPPAKDSVVYIIRRRDLARGGGEVSAKKISIPREAAHFTCDYDNPQGRITLHLGHNNAADPANALRANDVRADNGGRVRPDLVGMLTTTTDVNAVGRYVVDGESGRLLSAAVTYDPTYLWVPALYTHRGSNPGPQLESIYWSTLGFSPELLPRRVHDEYRDYAYRQLPIEQLPREPKPSALLRLDARALVIADAFSAPPGRVLMSPQFVPRAGGRGGSTDGYIVTTMISDDTGTPGSTGDEIWIFDAANLAQGPLCRLAHSALNLPLSLHTAWLETISPRTATYKIRARDDFESRVASQPADVQQIFEREVYPRFA